MTDTLFTGRRAIDMTQRIIEVHYVRAATPEYLDCNVVLEDGSQVLAFRYRQFSLTFGDELVGQRLCDARDAFRVRDIAAIQRMLDPSPHTPTIGRKAVTSLQPDTDTLDRVYDLITRVPALHRQHTIDWPVDRVDLAVQLAKASDLRLLAGCGSAHCVAGWVLELHEVPIPEEASHALRDAARLVRIDPDEAYDDDHHMGIFYDTTTVEQIGAWIRYYKGEIDRGWLLVELGREDLLEEGGPRP